MKYEIRHTRLIAARQRRAKDGTILLFFSLYDELDTFRARVNELISSHNGIGYCYLPASCIHWQTIACEQHAPLTTKTSTATYLPSILYRIFPSLGPSLVHALSISNPSTEASITVA